MERKVSDKKSVAVRLREARAYAGLSQSQVAKILSMHRPTISEIEAGRRRVSAEELAEFARIYDVNASWLLAESRDPSDAEAASIELAARELSKLKKEDRETVIRLLRSLSSRKDEAR
jgi:transcriptional regulator with XRE-family HTH domain